MTRVVGIIFAFLLVTACASQSPIQDVRPEVSVQELNIGFNRAVFLEVLDQRVSVDGSQIESEGILASDFSLDLELKREVRAALFNFGFITAHQLEESDLKLGVSINQLDYIASDDPLVNAVFMRCKMSFELQKNNVLHTFVYATERTQKLALAPSVDTARQLISEILGDTMQRAVNDPSFIAELSTP